MKFNEGFIKSLKDNQRLVTICNKTTDIKIYLYLDTYSADTDQYKLAKIIFSLFIPGIYKTDIELTCSSNEDAIEAKNIIYKNKYIVVRSCNMIDSNSFTMNIDITNEFSLRKDNDDYLCSGLDLVCEKAILDNDIMYNKIIADGSIELLISNGVRKIVDYNDDGSISVYLPKVLPGELIGDVIFIKDVDYNSLDMGAKSMNICHLIGAVCDLNDEVGTYDFIVLCKDNVPKIHPDIEDVYKHTAEFLANEDKGKVEYWKKYIKRQDKASRDKLSGAGYSGFTISIPVAHKGIALYALNYDKKYEYYNIGSTTNEGDIVLLVKNKK